MTVKKTSFTEPLPNVRQQIREKAKTTAWIIMEKAVLTNSEKCLHHVVDENDKWIRVENVDEALDGLAEKLEEDVDLRIIHTKMIEELGYAPTSPNYIDGFINGYKKAREEVLACLRETEPQK